MSKKFSILQTKLISIPACIFTLFSFTSITFADSDSHCVPVRGKIFDNLQTDGSTLGVIHLKLGDQKLKCAMNGTPQSAIQGVDYRHTIVCDNKTSSEEAQAQVTLNTSFINIMPTGSCPAGSPGGLFSFSIIERSIPDPDTARAALSGITAERGIIIQGDLNCNTGGIKMELEGELCFRDFNDHDDDYDHDDD